MIELGTATRALHEPSGDRHTVIERSDGVLVAAIDGLGHGSAAAEASDVACETLAENPGTGLEELLRLCHEALVGTRGVVMTLVDFDERSNSATWVGVGNVEGRLLRAGEPAGITGGPTPTLFGGVLGHQLPSVRTSRTPVGHGDLVVLATDGVRADFATLLSTAGPPEAIAERVMERSGRHDDDALVVVVRWLGASR